MTVNYNCEQNTISINPPVEGLIQFGVKKGCSEDIATNVYCQENTYVNFINAESFVDNYTQYYHPNCSDPPGTGCNYCPQYVTFNYGLNVDLDKVTGVSGTVTITENGSVVSTTNITNLSYFTNTYSYQTYYDFSIVYELDFTCTNGILFHLASSIFSNGQSCDIESYGTTEDYHYDCQNTYVNGEGYSIIDIVLEDGFYTTSVNGEYNCFIVECEPLECKIYNTLNFDCKDCETNNLDMFTWYLSLQNCSDCCTKNALYRKIYAELNKCETC